jgi:hypothetical protein
VPLHFPVESEVRNALHDLLLKNNPDPVEPSDAYRALADQFQLPANLREKRMENSD